MDGINFKFGYLKVLLLYLLYFLLNFILGYYLGNFIEENYGLDKLYFSFILTSILLLIPVSYFWKRLIKGEVLNSVKVSFRSCIVVIIIGLFLFCFSNIFTNGYLILDIYDYPNLEEVFLDNLHGVISFFDLVFVVPIIEELFFRGILLVLLLKMFKKNYLPLFLSSFIFSIDHIHWFYLFDSLPNMINALFFGLISGWVLIQTKNIIYCVLLHIINNLMAYLTNVYNKEYWNAIEYFDFNYRYWVLILGALILMLLLLRSIRTNNPVRQSL